MRPQTMLLRFTAAFALALWLPAMQGCAGADDKTRVPAANSATIAVKARIIIRFSDAITNPADARYLDKLGRAAGARFTYVRAVSGGAHIVEAQLADQAQLAEVLRRLSKRPDIVYAQLDRMVQPQ